MSAHIISDMVGEDVAEECIGEDVGECCCDVAGEIGDGLASKACIRDTGKAGPLFKFIASCMLWPGDVTNTGAAEAAVSSNCCVKKSPTDCCVCAAAPFFGECLLEWMSSFPRACNNSR